MMLTLRGEMGCTTGRIDDCGIGGSGSVESSSGVTFFRDQKDGLLVRLLEER